MQLRIVLTENISPLESEITALVDHMETVYDEQRYQWERERTARNSMQVLFLHFPASYTHFAANESTNSRVMWFAVLELIVLVVLAAGQIYVLTGVFENRTKA